MPFPQIYFVAVATGFNSVLLSLKAHVNINSKWPRSQKIKTWYKSLGRWIALLAESERTGGRGSCAAGFIAADVRTLLVPQALMIIRRRFIMGSGLCGTLLEADCSRAQ